MVLLKLIWNFLDWRVCRSLRNMLINLLYCQDFAFYLDDDAPIEPTFEDLQDNLVLSNNSSLPVGRLNTLEISID